MSNTRDSADVWTQLPDGRKFWGKYGAAGLLIYAQSTREILLQHRAGFSHFGGTWGIPGGARHADETAQDAAIRESEEEATVPAQALTVLSQSVLDLGAWSYTTVLATVTEPFTATVGDAESIELRWVAIDQVSEMDLHPMFAQSWPKLRGQFA